MTTANNEPAATAARDSWRDVIGRPLRTRRSLAAAELLFILLPFALRALGVIRNASLLLLLIAFLSLWLRRVGWRGVGLRRPANWTKTVLLAIGIGIAYNAADILAILPAIRKLTGQAVELEQFGALKGNAGALLTLLALTWTLAAFGEEMAYRGYALNRIADLLGRSRAAFVLSALIVSALFGYAHIAQGISGVLDSVLAGVLFATLYFASGRNLWLPVLVHGVVDTTSFVLLFLGLAPK
jgi:membrane protease YdiL (CAAX protease family)